jgi:hypothetical protein
MSMRKLWIGAALLLVLWGGTSWWQHRPLHQPPGVIAPDEPEQDNIEDGAKLHHGDVTLTTRARFILTARVLSRKDYSWGDDAKLIPEDLALGWGRMSDSACWRKSTSPSPIASTTGTSPTVPIPRREIETSSANMHMIPADAGVKYQLEQVRVGQVVHIEGFLVDATRPDGWHWNTSMTRDDVGRGCVRADLRGEPWYRHAVITVAPPIAALQFT